MYRYGINTSILHLTFSLPEQVNELTKYGIICRKVIIFYPQELVFISSAGKIESVKEFKIKLFK